MWSYAATARTSTGREATASDSISASPFAACPGERAGTSHDPTVRKEAGDLAAASGDARRDDAAWHPLRLRGDRPEANALEPIDLLPDCRVSLVGDPPTDSNHEVPLATRSANHVGAMGEPAAVGEAETVAGW
jgi:hypothetical protein